MTKKPFLCLAFATILAGTGLAKPKAFTDPLGHTLTVGQDSSGIDFWIIEDGRSAETGPTVDRRGAQQIGGLLLECWSKRNTEWESETFRSGQDWVKFVAQKGNIMVIAGDKKHTAKSFTIGNTATVNAIAQELGTSAAPRRIDAAYPTRPR